MYVNVKLRRGLWNHCISAKEIPIVYSECVLVALSIQRAMRMRHIICGQSDCNLF